MATTAAPSTSSDYFASRSSPRTRPSLAPRSPRTPLLGRSISGQFGSPGGSYVREQEEVLVYELAQRYLSVGIAGEGRPRAVLRFGYELGDGRRVGDWRGVEDAQQGGRGTQTEDDSWGSHVELFRANLADSDLGLVEDVLERAVRTLHIDALQMDAKPRKAVFAVPSLLPTSVLEIALKVLFTHHSQPPAITLLPTPLLACVGAGLRNALVIEIGWEETVVTAIGEYKTVVERRSIRAGRQLVRNTRILLRNAMASSDLGQEAESGALFAFAEDATQRLAYCWIDPDAVKADSKSISIPSPGHPQHLDIPFSHLAIPAEQTFFPSDDSTHRDDNDKSLPQLVFANLLALPTDLRAQCMSRILLTGSSASIPGLRTRLLREVSKLVEQRGWDRVHSYGSAKNPLPQRLRTKLADEIGAPVPAYRPPAPLASIPSTPAIDRTVSPTFQENADANDSIDPLTSLSSSPAPKPAPPASSEHPPAHLAAHDTNTWTLRTERKFNRARETIAKNDVRGVLRCVDTLSAWAGASIFASLAKGNTGMKGVVEVTREEWEKKGLVIERLI